MPKVVDLLPGDLISRAGMKGLYVAQVPHPAWPRLRLVIWAMPDGEFSFDALSPFQHIGDYVTPVDQQARIERLHAAGILSDQALATFRSVPRPAADARATQDPEAWLWQ